MAKLDETSEHLINKHTGLSQQLQQEAAKGEGSSPLARTLSCPGAVGLEGQLKFHVLYTICVVCHSLK